MLFGVAGIAWASQAAEGLLFSDDFERDSLGPDWTVVDDPDSAAGPSQWLIENGALTQLSNIYLESGYGGTHAVAGSSAWTEYSVTASVTPRDNDGWGLIVGYRDPGNYCRFFTVADPGNGGPFRRLERFVNGTRTTLAESGGAFQVNERYLVGLEAVGQRLTVWLNGAQVLTAAETGVLQGKVGFATYACSIEVDRVRVRSGTNLPPTIQLSAPLPDAVFFAPANLTLKAEAADADGAVARVEFFLGTTKVAEAATPPYLALATNLGIGSYTFTAKAYDSQGETTTSAPLSVEVRTSDLDPRITGQWDFDQADLRAGVGNALEYFAEDVRQATRFGSTRDFGLPDIAGQPAKVMRVPPLARMGGYLARHGIGPNGGGRYVNQYTLILDVFYPTTVAEEWKALLQTDADNLDDGDFFINSAGGVGIGTYQGQMSFGQWHRVALSVDLVSRVVAKYVDGAKVGEQTLSAGVDKRWALWPADSNPNYALLFADNDGENCECFVNSVQFRAGRMSDTALAALGQPSATGIPFPKATALMITRGPQEQTVEEGDRATFSVAVRGAEPLHYQWQFNGTPLPGNTTATLVLEDVQTNQAGLYTVVVSDAAGSVTSPPGRLTVTSLPSSLPRLAIERTAAGMQVDYWLRAKRGFYSLLSSDAVGGLSNNTRLLFSAPISPAGRVGSIRIDPGSISSTTRFFRVREQRGFTNEATRPFFAQSLAPSTELRTVDCGEGVRVQIPGGALTSPQLLTVARLAPQPALPCPKGIVLGTIYEISLGGQSTFPAPLILEIPYVPEELNPELGPSHAVTAACWNPEENAWSMTAATVDSQRKVLVVPTRHLSFWGSAYVLKGYRVLTDPLEQVRVVFHPLNKGAISGDAREAGQQFTGEELARLTFDCLTNALSAYRRVGFTEVALPVWAFLDPDYKEAVWSGYTGNIYLPLEYRTTTELRSTAGHELFHQVQNSYYTVFSAAYGSGKWWHEACAEYAGQRLAAGNPPPFQLTYFPNSFLQEPLTTVDESHEYGAANFLDYVFTASEGAVTLKGQFDELTSSSLTETVLDRLDAYVERQTSAMHLLRTLFFSFADQFYLNKSGLKPSLDIWRNASGPNERPGAQLLSTQSRFEHTFQLQGGYTAKVLTLRINAATDASARRLRVIHADGPGDDSGVVRMFLHSHEPRFADAAAVTLAGSTLGAPGTPFATNVVAAKDDDYLMLIASDTLSHDSAVTVVVEDAPGIRIEPASCSLGLNMIQEFTAEISGTADEAVVWSIREGATGGQLTGAGATTVQYRSPANLAGTFHVVATSAQDPTLTAEATVVVTGYVTVEPSFKALVLGESATFTAKVAGVVNPAVDWRVFEGGNAGALTFPSAGSAIFTPSLLGYLRLIATSQADPTLKGEARVQVLFPIDISYRAIDSNTTEYQANPRNGVPPYTDFVWYYGFALGKSVTGNPVRISGLDRGYDIVVKAKDSAGHDGRGTF